MDKGTTVTDAINAGDLSLAISRASDLMNGNQEIQTALTTAQASAKQAAADVAAALAIADGN
jgi:hypothetical protein